MINDSAKTIVCYGDSNTWGSVPRGAEVTGRTRYPRSIRWTGVLQKLLGDDYEVINEGTSARTFSVQEEGKPERTGITHLRSILKTNTPIDLVIVALGTNDTKGRYGLSAEIIASHLEQTIKLIKEEGLENILILCPSIPIQNSVGKFYEDFENSLEKIVKFPELFKDVAIKYSCRFLNAADYITASDKDGLHLEPESHQKLAEVLATEIRKII
ncbi:MAG: acylhydrolase [Candidatus Pacebacteria bacterium]|nr:acylhydrolase [Candidatus Paceibacterota bacterium]